MSDYDYSNYVRAMAYGPSQNEYTHDTLNGPFGKLQQGDIAMSPDLQKRYPLGSYVTVQPKEGEPFRARVADHSYIKPGEPTKNTIEVWNGQDLGHATITPTPAPIGPPISGGNFVSQYSAGVGSNPAGISGVGPTVPSASQYQFGAGANPAQMSSMADYGSAINRGQNIAAAGQIIGSALQNLGRSQTQNQTNPLAMMQQRRSSLADLAPVPFRRIDLMAPYG